MFDNLKRHIAKFVADVVGHLDSELGKRLDKEAAEEYQEFQKKQEVIAEPVTEDQLESEFGPLEVILDEEGKEDWKKIQKKMQ